MLIAEWQVGQALLAMIYFFFLFMFIWIFVALLMDLFRDHELSGWGKAGWVILLVIFPFLGCLIYLIARGKGMAQRSIAAQQAAQAQFDQAVREAAGTPGASPADQLAKLHDLKTSGAISDEEYAKMKAQIVG